MVRMKLPIGWLALALVCTAAACEKRDPAPPAPSAPPPTPITPPPAPPPPPPPVPADASAPESAPVQTPPAASKIDFSKVPEFGCLAWSRTRELAACVTGSRGFNVGSTTVRLVFVPLGDAEAPETLALLDLQQENPGPDDLPQDLAKRFEASLTGFTPLNRNAPFITVSGEGSSLVKGSPLSVGGMSISVRANRAPPLAFAPAYHATLTVRGPDGSQRPISDLTAPMTLEARAFPLRDRQNHSVVLVEQVYSVGDEGTYGSHGTAWRCTAKECQEQL
jgi:hypothetical protein